MNKTPYSAGFPRRPRNDRLVRPPRCGKPGASGRGRRLRAAGVPAGLAAAWALVGTLASAQGKVTGTVVIAATGEPAHGAEVTVVETGEVAHTDHDGLFEIPMGHGGHDHHADHHGLTLHAELGGLVGARSYPIKPPKEGTLALPEPIRLESRPHVHERVIVTASTGEGSSFDVFGSVSSFSGLDLHNEGVGFASLLGGIVGVAARGAGPASERPILRGFDGSRVLVMEDGVETGDTSGEFADGGTAVDLSQAERIEVVRGPATLLYGSNLIGGAVNVISMGSHLSHAPPAGARGRASLAWSSAEEGVRGGTRAMAAGDGWFAWGGGNSHRRGDYRSPDGAVENSGERMDQGEAGFGLFGDRAWFSTGLKFDDSRYGIPFSFPGQLTDIAAGRRQLRTDFGVHELGTIFEEAEITVRYSDAQVDEVATYPDGRERVYIQFDDRSVIFRGELKKPTGRTHSRIGVWGHLREYESAVLESLAPGVRQNAFAAFAYNEIHASERLGLLLAGRLERNAYGPLSAGRGAPGGERSRDHREATPGNSREVMRRNFLGFAGSAGFRFSLTDADVLVATASLSHRPPAIKELYNFGSSIEDPNLDPERSLGLEVSLRRQSEDFAGSLNLFRYGISDFIFGAAAGKLRRSRMARVFLQSDARYQGFEAETDVHLGHANLAATVSWIHAKLTPTGEYAPRIPPLQGKVGLDVPIGLLRIAPEARWAAGMDRLYPGETPTDGYVVFDLSMSYLVVGHHTTHNFALEAYNLTNSRYRHHPSPTKEFFFQLGRGFRISYSIRFF